VGLARLAHRGLDESRAVVREGEFALVAGLGRVFADQPIEDGDAFGETLVDVVPVADLVGEVRVLVGCRGQSLQGFGPGLGIDLELFAETAEEGDRLDEHPNHRLHPSRQDHPRPFST